MNYGKGLYTNRNSLDLFLERQFSMISLKIGYFSYVFLLLYGILAIYSLGGIHKTQQNTCMIGSLKIVDIPPPPRKAMLQNIGIENAWTLYALAKRE